MLVHTLPNGLGIYRTPFVDQYGSNLAHGGPHKIFSRGGPMSYNKLMGSLRDRTAHPDSMVPEMDCSLMLQIPMCLPGHNGSCLILGYKWNPEEDYFSPGIGELNFNSKVRGAKAPNKAPVTTG